MLDYRQRRTSKDFQKFPQKRIKAKDQQQLPYFNIDATNTAGGDDSYDSGLSSDHSGNLRSDFTAAAAAATFPTEERVVAAGSYRTPLEAQHHGSPLPGNTPRSSLLSSYNSTNFFRRHNSDPSHVTTTINNMQLQPNSYGAAPQQRPTHHPGIAAPSYSLQSAAGQPPQYFQSGPRNFMHLRHPAQPATMGVQLGGNTNTTQRLQYMAPPPQQPALQAMPPRHQQRYMSAGQQQYAPAVLSKHIVSPASATFPATQSVIAPTPIKRLVRGNSAHSATVLYNGDSDTGVYGSADEFAYYPSAKPNLGYSSDSELAVYNNMGNLSLGPASASYLRNTRRPGPSHSSDEQELYSSMRAGADFIPTYASYDDPNAFAQHDSGQYRTKFYPPYDSEYLSDPMLINKHFSNVSSGPLSYFRKFSADLNNPNQFIPDSLMSDIKSCSSDPTTRPSDRKSLFNNSSGGLAMSYFNAGMSTSPMTREDVMNLRGGRQKFRVKDWEMARFSSKVNTSEFEIQSSDNYNQMMMIKKSAAGTPPTSASSSAAASFPASSYGGGSFALSRVTTGESVGISGILMVHIIAGTGLHSSHAVLRDLYCVVEIDSTRKARSMIRTNTECFEWDEVFDLEVDCNRCISFLLYQWDPRNRHRLCFYGNKNLGNIVDGLSRLMAMSYQQQVTQKIALKLEPKGLLYVDLGFVPLHEAYNRVRMTHHSALFGAPLDFVIKRERTRWRVPCLIKKCIDEVDKRGLDVIGVYRLTGSAKLKAYIREMFERSPTDVDLSSERVPDLHAITAVLKDYLRELPEPLFTNSLYKMILDAVHVTLPGENHSRGAKLMLNILDCLPSTNQDTLLFLLDHLKRVTNKSEANKMTPLTLASSFAPVLLYPSPEAARLMDPEMLELSKMTEIMRFILEIWPENKIIDRGESFDKSITYEQHKKLKSGQSGHHKSGSMAGGSLTSSRESDSSRHLSARPDPPQHRALPHNSDSMTTTSAQRRRKTGPTKPSLRYNLNRSSSDERKHLYHSTSQ